MGNKITIQIGDEEEKDEMTFGRVLLRLIVWLLIIGVVFSLLMVATGSCPWCPPLLTEPVTGSTPEIGQGGEKGGTEGGSQPGPTAPAGADDNPAGAPTAAVIWPTQVNPTPVVYPAPAQPAPQQPAAGICAQTAGELAPVEIRADAPAPRCLILAPGQRLLVTNRVDQSLTVCLESACLSIGPGQSASFSDPVEANLGSGVHQLEAAPFSGPEIWIP